MLVLQGLLGHAYFAVFDGHAGVEAANYAKCHLLGSIVRHPLFTKNVSKAIGEGIVTTDKNFCSKAEEEVGGLSNLKYIIIDTLSISIYSHRVVYCV